MLRAQTSYYRSRPRDQGADETTLQSRHERQPGEHHAAGRRASGASSSATTSASSATPVSRTSTTSCRCDVDLVFIGAFTASAQTAYAISNLLSARGAVTVLGGPHARCYPQDAGQYFDYVLGFTDKTVILDVLRDCAPHRPARRCDSARGSSPTTLPGWQERWKFIEPTLAQGAVLQDRADARQPGLPLHLQLLHRFGRSLISRCTSSRSRRTCVSCWTKFKRPLRRLARPEFRRPLRRLHGRDRGGGAARQHRLHRREQPVAAVRAAREAPGAERLHGHAARASNPGTTSATSRRPAHARAGQGPPGRRPREHDPALHPVCADQLRAGARLRPRAPSRSS